MESLEAMVIQQQQSFTNAIMSHETMDATRLSLQQDLTPVLYIKLTSIQGIHLDRALLSLADSGSTTTMINRTCFPFGVDTFKGPLKLTSTTNGTYKTSESIVIHMKFPEFGNRSIGDVKADVFYSPH